jgi:hypothetical protein
VLENKQVHIEDFQNSETAYKVIEQAIALYKERFSS